MTKIEDKEKINVKYDLFPLYLRLQNKYFVTLNNLIYCQSPPEIRYTLFGDILFFKEFGALDEAYKNK
ncbi:hypothetical protein [Thermoflavimicrobium dichotomicum]|uniref:Uncharacterized protein n=1 Tax=Thermoflavimicrobium dichotomicum TaxID=46223 RepID=A0A1I3UX82_9BACL|nr:hypothetical protein [Thermoflavimicrobium dichotomicum]SFJ87289.1 hypothetical protein SAMN05421852_1298 [Thermoflavimicrobium dichotomicum]